MTAKDNSAQSAAFRASLRRECIARRESLATAERAQYSAVIEAALVTLLAPQPPATLAFCWPIRAEFDCRPLARHLMAKGWRTCIPAVTAPNSPMAFRVWAADTPMGKDLHGIPIPARGDELKPDILLLPLVAFDTLGYRLGYGGGYFDRTMAALVPRPVAIGVGFELARVATIRPDAHDLAMDLIVTEAGVMRISDRL